jgi:hypothetical protein
MAALASEFPGALREIDDLELDVIRGRIHQLDAATRGEVPVEAWMEAISLFHEMARGALGAKRWLAGRKTVDATTHRAFVDHAGSLPARSFGREVLAWSGDLAVLAAPPRGRILDIVFARVAASLGVTEGEARRLVFGVPRRERRR